MKGGKMELKNIKYKSAVFFAAIGLVMYLLIGALQLLIANDPVFVAMYGAVSTLQALVYTPILGAVILYVLMILMIFVYNLVAKKYPISWEIKK